MSARTLALAGTTVGTRRIRKIFFDRALWRTSAWQYCQCRDAV